MTRTQWRTSTVSPFVSFFFLSFFLFFFFSCFCFLSFFLSFFLLLFLFSFFLSFFLFSPSSFFSFQLYCPTRISPMGNLGCIPGESQLGQSRYPAYDTCWVCLCFYNPPNSDMDYRIFSVRTDVSACDSTRGCADNVTDSALKVD